MTEAELVLNSANKLGEGPLWDHRSGTLLWLDIEQAQLWQWQVGHCDPHALALPGTAACLGLTAGGMLVAGTAEGFAFLNPVTGKLDSILIPAEKDAAVRFNDGAVGPDGGLWAGTLSDNPVNHLYRLAPDLSYAVKESGIRISNGIGWSPDHKRMYYTDSLSRRIDVFDYDMECADISNRRCFADFSREESVPDGLAVDSEGCVWSAHWDGWKVTRSDPDGKLMSEIRLPVQRPTSCAFGGPDLQDLYITCAWTGLDRSRPEHAAAGALFCLHTAVCGQVEYLFSA